MILAKNDQNQIEQWLVTWFSEKRPSPEGDLDAIRSLDFFAAGMIDSFGMVELVIEIEAEFGFQFSAEQFQDRRFPTISGLTQIITEARATI